jgi:DNA-binding transcriptional ArsR family regulator
MNTHTPSNQPTEQRAAEGLAALGNATRLRLFRLLVKAGPAGTTIGEAQSLLGVPASTLAHHFQTLLKAGLIAQERRGRECFCTADFAAVQGLVDYLTAECCVGLADANNDFAASEDAA